MRRTSTGEMPWCGARWRRWANAAALAAVGVLGVVPATVAAASSQAPTWTKQAPASSPRARFAAAMAYDAATGTVVLFGGENNSHVLGANTWTWDGTTWTKKQPATSPFGRSRAAMAYDAAAGTVVLFGGLGRGMPLADTWTWGGTTWTKRHPATSPSPRLGAAMAYDAATGTVVLFGGFGGHGTSLHLLGDTWVWDGTTWTKQHPASSPDARVGVAMAYDAHTGTVVLFGGEDGHRLNNDTWVWDGTTWTKRHPATSPSPRFDVAMTYDAATGTAVLFGGFGGHGNIALGRRLGDTWVWNGTTWTKQAPAVHPSNRELASMAYDAATRSVVMFAGDGNTRLLADTWIWR
jgi:hypothetical protein